jgi:tetratricopeptide (TPR) repeat protein
MQTLTALLSWLVEQKEWKAIDDLVRRLGRRLSTQPELLYTLAEAYAEQGRKDEAQRMADQAFRAYPPRQEDQLHRHLDAARQLSVRGQFIWARREFEHVIAQSGPDESALRVAARMPLAYMLHDQGLDFAAASVLQKLVEAIDAGQVTQADLGGSTPAAIRAQMHYLFACRWQATGEAAKQRDCLDKAFLADPADIDVLIACYRLAGQPPEQRAKIAAAIDALAARLRKEIAQQPDAPDSYNQYAWLVGNTRGDFDEAIKYSRKSLELRPDYAGYYDTLAHAYFGKGDLKSAVRYQAQAAELDPHSGLIRRDLDIFRKKLQGQK